MSASSYYDQVQSAAARVRSTSACIPDVAVVLGSGLGDFASSLGRATSIRYEEIPHWPASNVVGHEGRLVMGEVSGRLVAALSGRAHFYEGHDLPTVTFATRVLGVLGVKVLILTNAAGGINTAFAPGDLMVIDDHINLLGTNPLVGPNDERFGVRFPDLTNVYSPRLRAIAGEVAGAQGQVLRHGIYVACHGPSVRNSCRSEIPPVDRGGRGGDVHGPRGHRGAAYGSRSAGDFVYHESGRGRAAAAAEPRRST